MIFNLLYFFFLYQSYNLYNPLGQIFTTEINEIWDQLNNLNKSFDIIEDNNLSEIVISISGPIYINNSRNGFLIIFLSFDKVLQISQDYSGLGNTGETVLAKRDENGYALFISPLRFDNYAALNKTISKLDINVPIIQALQKQEIFFPSSLDYRSENVLATTRYIESIDLGLVVKIDYNQAFQNLNTFTNLIVFFITLIILVLILISYLVSRSITVPILNLIKLTEEISKGDYSRKISIKSNNELKILGNSFNKMTSSLVLSNQGLIDSKNQIEAIINNMTTGILVLNHIGGVIYINKTYKDMYSALTESEIPPVNNLADKIINNDFTDIIIKFLNQESFIEDTVEMQDDLHLRINKTSIIDKNNDITGYIFQLTDVSSFIEYEKLQKKFISTVSHELRTPITGIILTINNLKKYLPKLTEDQTKSMINTIIDRSSVLLDLIEDLLFLLRTESQSIKLSSTAINVIESIKICINEFQNLLSREIQIEFKYDSNNIIMKGDLKRFNQILRIFIDNAIKFSKPGGKVSIEVTDAYKGKFNRTKEDCILISIIDNGIGINKVDLSLISPEDVRFGKSLGADDYLTKPFNEDKLLNMIHNKLENSKI